MAYFKGVFIPSLSATLNVAWETIKAKWPENSPCMEIIRNAGGGGVGGEPRGPSGNNFRSFNEEGENTEMTTMKGNEGYGEQGIAEDSFSYQRSRLL